MDHKDTLAFYNQHTATFIKRTFDINMQTLYDPFLKQLSQTQVPHILDVGCGSGRDSLYFADHGFRVTAIDGSDAIICQAKQKLFHPSIHWQLCTFKNLATLTSQQRFTGIWACASLLHVPFASLPALIDELLNLLIKDGVLYASFKYGDTERMDEGRFFCDMNEALWMTIKAQMHTKTADKIWITTDQQGLQSQHWFNVLMMPV